MPQILRVGGTSAGAITTVLVALRYNREDIFRILSTLD
jgi:predicted acylesterase/phospholipase RssA